MSYNQYDEEEFSNVEEEQQETLSWKKEQYMDASGAWRKPGDGYIDESGAWRRPGEQYVDHSGGWRN